jgi:hypothetical protein
MKRARWSSGTKASRAPSQWITWDRHGTRNPAIATRPVASPEGAAGALSSGATPDNRGRHVARLLRLYRCAGANSSKGM